MIYSTEFRHDDLFATVSFGGGGVPAYGYSGSERNPHTRPASGPPQNGAASGLDYQR